jgi:Prealbumin-like fold domain
MARKVIGPTGSRRRRWLFLCTSIAVLAAAAFFIAGAGATIGASNFEGNDGNLVVNTAGNRDWNNAPNLSVGVDKASGTQDNSFGQGAKEDNTNVTVVSGSIPNSKADLARFAVAGEVIGNDTYMYLAWSRENQSGTVNFDFELNKLAQPDLTTPGPKVLNRSVNDLLINYAFAGGSNTPTLTRYHWNGSNWVNDGLISGTCSEGATNSQTVSDTLGGNPAVSRPAQQFGEASINLTCAGIVPSGACESFGSAYVKSRSSTSFTSEIKDFIAPVSVSFSNCGEIIIKKHTNPRGLDQSFSYTATSPSGSGYPASFSLNDAGNSAGGDSTGNTQDNASLKAGTYTVTEGADPNGFAFNNVSCTGGGANTSVSGRVATIGLDPGETVTCTYVNDQQLGAIQVLKESTKNGNPPLAGATFSVTGPNSFSATLTTGTDGTDCVDNLPFGDYTVTETGAPDGYRINDSTGHTVTVNVNTDCSGSPQDIGGAFLDTPLTDISASVASEAVGGTQSNIHCVDSSNNEVGDSPQPSSGNAESATTSATGLDPGVYTCTITIDP